MNYKQFSMLLEDIEHLEDRKKERIDDIKSISFEPSIFKIVSKETVENNKPKYVDDIISHFSKIVDDIKRNKISSLNRRNKDYVVKLGGVFARTNTNVNDKEIENITPVMLKTESFVASTNKKRTYRGNYYYIIVKDGVPYTLKIDTLKKPNFGIREFDSKLMSDTSAHSSIHNSSDVEQDVIIVSDYAKNFYIDLNSIGSLSLNKTVFKNEEELIEPKSLYPIDVPDEGIILKGLTSPSIPGFDYPKGVSVFNKIRKNAKYVFKNVKTKPSDPIPKTRSAKLVSREKVNKKSPFYHDYDSDVMDKVVIGTFEFDTILPGGNKETIQFKRMLTTI